MCSVLGTFYVIRFGLTGFLSCGIAVLLVQSIMFYVLCMRNAYLIPQTMNQTLQNLKLMSPANVGEFRKQLKQRIRSVRRLTIMEGAFIGVSRETTPAFCDLDVNHINWSCAYILTSMLFNKHLVARC